MLGKFSAISSSDIFSGPFSFFSFWDLYNVNVGAFNVAQRKAFDSMDHNKLWKILQEREYQTTWPGEICIQVKKQQLELDIEQQTGSKLGKAVYCHPAYLTYRQCTLCEMPGWMKHKLESGLSGEISITSDIQMTSPLWQKAKRN